MTLGEWLRVRIEEKNVTQAALARATGLSLGRISGYLADRDRASLENIRLICRALGTSLATLDRDVELKPVTKAETGDGRSRRAQQ